MAAWKLDSNRPLTTERFVRVRCGDLVGYRAVAWESCRAKIYGPVTDIPDSVAIPAWIVGSEREAMLRDGYRDATVIDAQPTQIV